MCVNRQLAKTLRRVAAEGPGILRQGPLANSLAQAGEQGEDQGANPVSHLILKNPNP